MRRTRLVPRAAALESRPRGPMESALPWVAGAAAGFVAGWWWSRRAADPEDGIDEGWAERWGEAVDAAMEAAADGLRLVERRWRASRPLEATVLADALETLEGGEDLEVRTLGPGLVEVVGDASEATADRAVAAVGAIPGVRVVLNRIWTPSSAHPRQIDAPSAFE